MPADPRCEKGLRLWLSFCELVGLMLDAKGPAESRAHLLCATRSGSCGGGVFGPLGTTVPVTLQEARRQMGPSTFLWLFGCRCWTVLLARERSRTHCPSRSCCSSVSPPFVFEIAVQNYEVGSLPSGVSG